MPADSTTARTAPPAMMPVPSGAGFNSTDPAPKWPCTGCGIDDPAIGARTSAFFAASIAFLIAEGTSFALPMPNPTTPWPSPTTTSALKLRFLPPLTTFVTRLIDTTVSLISSCPGSIRSLVFMCVHRQPAAASTSEFQTRLARRIRNRANTAVIQKAAAIEHHAFDPFVDRPFRDRLANGLGALQVSAADILRERALDPRLHTRCRRERLAFHVIDHLRVDVRHAAEDG